MKAVALSLVVALHLAAAPAGAASRPSVASTPAVAGPGGSGLGYLTPVIVASKSGDLTFVNLDVAPHDVVHDVVADGSGGPQTQPWCKPKEKKSRKESPKSEKKRNKNKSKKSKKKNDRHDHDHAHGTDCPVFWSAVVGTGETSEVLGLENLEPGKSYSFFCTIHHNMKGTLIATD